jgi:large subunit ribosomal protein L35Ae
MGSRKSPPRKSLVENSRTGKPYPRPDAPPKPTCSSRNAAACNKISHIRHRRRSVFILVVSCCIGNEGIKATMIHVLMKSMPGGLDCHGCCGTFRSCLTLLFVLVLPFSFSICSAVVIMSPRPPKLHIDGAILGYQRGLRTQNCSVSLIKIKGVDSKMDTDFYLGKKIAFITKAEVPDKFGNKFRVNWGKVCRAHGANGVVRCRFRRNLPPASIGGKVRVMLYPSRV